ncbi:hypothetical protein J6590_083578 [Homalodisca vitripennis]|nr:hypothetical protein J6590_083578 [Homalodisca vitripennis]
MDCDSVTYNPLDLVARWRRDILPRTDFHSITEFTIRKREMTPEIRFSRFKRHQPNKLYREEPSNRYSPTSFPDVKSGSVLSTVEFFRYDRLDFLNLASIYVYRDPEKSAAKKLKGIDLYQKHLNYKIKCNLGKEVLLSVLHF